MPVQSTRTNPRPNAYPAASPTTKVRQCPSAQAQGRSTTTVRMGRSNRPSLLETQQKLQGPKPRRHSGFLPVDKSGRPPTCPPPENKIREELYRPPAGRMPATTLQELLRQNATTPEHVLLSMPASNKRKDRTKTSLHPHPPCF